MKIKEEDANKVNRLIHDARAAQIGLEILVNSLNTGDRFDDETRSEKIEMLGKYAEVLRDTVELLSRVE